jgi:chromosome segregation ATPase
MADKHKLHNINNKFADSLKKLRERKAKLEMEIAEHTREKDDLVVSLKDLKGKLQVVIELLVTKTKNLNETNKAIANSEKIYNNILNASENLLKMIMKEENKDDKKN